MTTTHYTMLMLCFKNYWESNLSAYSWISFILCIIHEIKQQHMTIKQRWNFWEQKKKRKKATWLQ